MRALSPLQKKGQIQSLTPAVLALVFAAIILVFGLVMTQSLTDTADDVTRTAFNETITNVELTTGGDSVSVDGAAYCNAGITSFAATYVTNSTGGDTPLPVVGSGNYTFSTAGVFTNLTSEYATNEGFNISYTQEWGGEACVAGNKTVVGLGTFADFWEIIVLAVVIAVVIGLLLIVFGGSVRRR